MKANLKKTVANIAWMLFDKVFILLLNLIVTVRIANYYGNSGYGVYQFAVSVISIFEICITFIDSRVVKKHFLSEDPSVVVWNTTIVRFALSIITILSGAVYILLCKESSEYKTVFAILLLNSVVIGLRFGMQSRYEYLLKSKRTVIASNIALTVGGLLQLSAVQMQMPISAIAFITAFSSLVSLCIVYAQYRKEFGQLKKGSVNTNLIRMLIIESLPLAIAAACSIIYSKCDSVMIGSIMSKEDVGIYAIAVKLISICQMAIAPIRESVYPKMIEIYNKDKEQYAEYYIQFTSLLTWVYILGVALSFVILPFFFQFLKPEYETAFPIYQVYVIGTFFLYNAGLRAGHFTLIKRGSILMYSQIISVILNIVLNLVLIRSVGIYGAAISTCITQGVSLMLSNIVFGEEGRQVLIWQLKGLNPFFFFRMLR